MLSSPSLVRAFLILALVAPATLRAEEPYEGKFRTAMNAYRKGNWAAAADGLQKAINDNSRESASHKVPTYGEYEEPYVPHFFRGVALAKLGRCNEARAELDTSREQGSMISIQKSRDAAFLLQAQLACPAPVPPPIVPNPIKPPVDTRGPQGQTDTRQTTPPITQPPTTTSPPVLPPSVQPQVDLTGPKQTLQASVVIAQDLLKTGTGLTTPRVSSLRKRLWEDIITATSATKSSSPVVIANASNSLAASVDEYRAVLRLLPTRNLSEGIRAYLAGNYGPAIKLLTNATTTDPNYRAQAVLFLAAARYSQFLLDGQHDKALEAQASNNAQEIRNIERKLHRPIINDQYAALYFSPKIRALIRPATR
jgi:hypothetical protein